MQFYIDNIKIFTGTGMGVRLEAKNPDKFLTTVRLLELRVLDRESNMYALHLETYESC